MLLDKATSQLFFAVLPAFVASLPRPVLGLDDQIQCPDNTSGSTKGQLEVHNAIICLRQAIHDLPKRFDPIRSAQDLSEDAGPKAADALEDILYAMERLVSTGILEHRGIAQKKEKFNRLGALRDLMGGSSWPSLEEEPAVPREALRWVTYLQCENQGTEAVQYRCIANQAERFNQIMGRLFELEHETTAPTAACFMGSSRLSEVMTEEDLYRKELSAAEGLRVFTKRLSRLIPWPSPESCKPPHGAMIHLNGFDQLELDTLITLCGTDETEKWHSITWVAKDPAERTGQSSICDKIRESRRLKSRLRVHVGTDGLWSGRNSERMETFAKRPALTLDSALNSNQGPLSGKRQRLDLAVKIARSFFCLIWSPLVCSPWNSATIHISEHQDRSQTVKPYIEGRLHFQDADLKLQPGCNSRRPLILNIGVLLWELLFGGKIVVTSEDDRSEETDEDDGDERDDKDTIGIFNALHREHWKARKLWVDEICLGIIGNCLDLYVICDDEANSAQVQCDIYHKIVRPLWDYADTYDESVSPVSNRPCTPSQIPAQQRIQPIKRSAPSACLPPAKRPRTAYPVSMAVPKIQPPSLTTSTSTISYLLTANGTISSSTEWLERFDNLKQQLQDALTYAVKIAILDTGCDPENEFFAGPGINSIDSIEANWTDYVDGKTAPCDEDPGRHGTALAALLIRLIPNCASIHVARVARNAAELADAKKNTAKAILGDIGRTADIICMAFGFGSDSDMIRKAIVQAETNRDDRIIFFAAANNDGLNGPELFPAGLENVISVRGTRYDGAFEQKYNPGSWSHKTGPQYGTLAVDVPWAWTTEELTKSGCSVATPIMAAIAAFVISYVGTSQHFDTRKKGVVRTRRGILSVFYEMTMPQHHARTDRLYLAPWFLSDNGSPIDLLSRALSKVPQSDPAP